MIRRSIAVDVIVDSLVHTEVSDDLNVCIDIMWMYCIVGRGLGTTMSTNLETPPSSPSLSRMRIKLDSEATDVDGPRHQRKTSTGSSPSRTSSDDDSRHSNSQMNSVTYIGGVTTRQAPLTVQRPSSANLTIGSSFRMKSGTGHLCPRCSKPVYSAEEVKAAGKVIISHFCLHSRLPHSSSPFTNDATLVLSVKRVSMLLDIRNTKENSTTTVSSMSDIDDVSLDDCL